MGFCGDFSIIGFAAEFKKDDAEYNNNQLTMVLATAQSHRKALGPKKSIIMGATGCRGQVQIYSSYWKSDYSCSRATVRSLRLCSGVTPLHLLFKAREGDLRFGA